MKKPHDKKWAATGLIDPKSVMPTTRKLGLADPNRTIEDPICSRSHSIIQPG
ncbi:MAG TPA: hypothetical protein VFK37_01425 [Bacillales bacterium]|nr:hypothetical protein [Bacillales bacterium]